MPLEKAGPAIDISKPSPYHVMSPFISDPEQLDVIVGEVSENTSWSPRAVQISGLYRHLSIDVQNRSSRVFVLPQEHSLGRILITSEAFAKLKARLGAFAALDKLADAFRPTDTDFYLSRGCAHFNHAILGEQSVDHFIESCSLLKFVEPNGRANRNTVPGWSVRQMGWYSSNNFGTAVDSTVLINPSGSAFERVSELLSRPCDHWSSLPVAIIKSLTAGWHEYTNMLHRDVYQMMLDSAFLNVSDGSEAEAAHVMDIEEIRRFTFLEDKLQVALQALRINCETLSAFLAEAEDWHKILVGQSDRRSRTLRRDVEDVRRELQFSQYQLESVVSRLKLTTSAYHDVAQMNNNQNTAKITERSVREAHSVRVIALVTFLFLPPTFTCSFFEMDLIQFTSFNNVTADSGLILWAVITLPLMAVTIGAWFLWDSRIRKAHDPRALRKDASNIV